MIHKTPVRAHFARAVHEYLLIEQTDLATADFGLVFGNPLAIASLAENAADLYHTGHFPLIVVSGGVQTPDGMLEAVALRQSLISRGVPDSVILSEPRSLHTGDNVTLTRALLQAEGLEADISSVISIGHIRAARRFLMTLERHWPGIHKMHSSANPYNTPAHGWHLNDHIRYDVMQEWRKIGPYLKQGWIAEVDIPALNRETARRRTQVSTLPASAP